MAAEEIPALEQPADEEPAGTPEPPERVSEEPPAAPAEEAETVLEERPEDLEMLEAVDEPAEASPPPTAAPPDPRTGEDVRNELRDYLNGVREKLGSAQEGSASPAGLLDYLEKLSDYLPEREKQRFLGSAERLAMESLKSRLAGSKGLRQTIAERYPPAAPRRTEPLTRPLVVNTFSYLKDLAGWHPDKAVGAAMKDRIESLVARMRRTG